MEPDLFGWKEISAFLRVHVDTARRYARDLGLPVRRFRRRVETSTDAVREWRERVIEDEQRVA